MQDRITRAIISFLVAKDPAYEGKKIAVSYKYTTRTFADLKARKGEVTFSVIELYPDFKPVGNIIVPVQVYVDGQEKEKLFLRTKVSVYENIVVAKKRLQRGDVIGSFEAGMEERDVAVLNPNVMRDVKLVYGRESKTFIPSGNPIYNHMIKDRSMVKKNDRIRISASLEGVVVSADGEALQDGNAGDEIKVKNLTSGKELVGIVMGNDEVSVK